ncbi:MAG TPA: FAD:protein FMN transferase [Candidatus Parabacteroides intestinigallinarum]|uniref:FAD:protein FMN transferase n=1 Tax=Candidatus Parabacteroides intestinigallinarum TaxID=2838722 RepID=A0A9D1XV82_9BACT|nr:FAD:protein FMN transferase [Candidatus Parabacteroides intestinigallinarum]
MRKLFAHLCLLVSILLISCGQEPRYYEVSGRLHTPYHIKFEHTKSLEKEIDEQLKYFYHLFNAFDSTSVISRVNRNEPVEVDTLFQRVFRKAMEVSALTDGAYDVTCAPLINLWGFGFSRMDSVTPARIDSLRQFIGFQKVRLEGNRVVKDDPRLIMNFSSIADGTVCDMIAQRLEREGVRNYMVEFGGEMRVRGVNPSGKNWRLGITRPSDDTLGINQALEQIVSFPRPLGMATSGNYRNFYVKDGKRYAHTIDPREGCPVQRDILSATIVAPDAMTADAFATAFMVLGSEQAKALSRKVPDIEYFIIRADSTNGHYHTECSEGFRRFIVE